MKKYFGIFLAIVLVLSFATYGYASRNFATNVTLTVGGSGSTDPSGPGGEDPDKPGGNDPDKPGEDDPDKPGGDPDKPGGDDPSKPGEDDPDKPGGDDPSKPGGDDPSKPGGNDPDKPGGDDPSKPGTDPSKPGSNTSRPGSSGGPSKPSIKGPGHSSSSTEAKGDKPGGSDSDGQPYRLLEGIHVAEGIHEKGYMYGYADLTFGPEKYLTRAQFAVIMDRVFSFSDEGTAKTFDDVQGHWAQGSIERLAAHGIIYGYSSTEFRPNNGVTRGQVLMMLSRVLVVSKYSKVSNVSGIDQYAAPDTIARVLNSGIYDEMADRYDLTAKITRVEMVHLLNNIIYERGATAPQTERIMEEHQIFRDLIVDKGLMYRSNCIKALNYDYVRGAAQNAA